MARCGRLRICAWVYDQDSRLSALVLPGSVQRAEGPVCRFPHRSRYRVIERPPILASDTVLHGRPGDGCRHCG